MPTTSNPCEGSPAEPTPVPPRRASPGRAGRILWRLLGRARRYGAAIAATVVITAALAAVDRSRVLFLEPFADGLREGRSLRDLTSLFYAVAGLSLATFFARYGREVLTAWLTNRFAQDLKQEVASHFLRLPLGYFTHQRTGDLLSRMTNDVGFAHQAIVFLFSDAILQPFYMAAAMGLILYGQPTLGLVIVVVVPLFALPLAHFGRQLRRVRRKSLDRLADLTQAASQILTGIRMVKAYQNEASRLSDFARINEEHFQLSMKAARKKALSEGLTDIFLGAGVLLFLFLGLLFLERYIPALQDTGKTMVLMGGTFLLFGAGREASRNWNKLQEAVAGTERLLELLDTPVEPPDAPDAVEIAGIREGIEFRDLAFAYDSQPVLLGIRLHARPGETLAIVGRTGAGKSTLMDLLVRFYDPREGAILVDGRDLRAIRKESWRRLLAVVPQDPFLFHGSIEDNLRLGSAGFTPVEIDGAIRAARLEEFVRRLPEGLATPVGERGVRLSGGERQRVAIARAILRRPMVLILDEPTSSLDSQTEGEIQEAVDRLLAQDRGSRITFVIAHRLSTVRTADRIVVLDGGRLVQQGTHAELLAQPGIYRELHEAQFQV